MSENENELENLFEIGDETQSLIKQARNRSRVRQVVVSLAAIVGVVILGWLTHLQITPHLMQQKRNEFAFRESIMGANHYETRFVMTLPGLGRSAVIEAVQYKLVGTKPVVIGNVGTRASSQVIPMSDGRLYSATGHKMMTFYHPAHAYDSVVNELDQIGMLPEDAVVEVGISLDRVMTYAELSGLLPEDVTINWCWVDGHEFIPEGYVWDESSVIGYPLFDEKGVGIEKAEGEWMRSLELISKKHTKDRKVYQGIYNRLVSHEVYGQKGQLPIIGAVVVGNQQALLKLQEIEGITGVVIGEVNTY